MHAKYRISWSLKWKLKPTTCWKQGSWLTQLRIRMTKYKSTSISCMLFHSYGKSGDMFWHWSAVRRSHVFVDWLQVRRIWAVTRQGCKNKLPQRHETVRLVCLKQVDEYKMSVECRLSIFPSELAQVVPQEITSCLDGGAGTWGSTLWLCVDRTPWHSRCSPSWVLEFSSAGRQHQDVLDRVNLSGNHLCSWWSVIHRRSWTTWWPLQQITNDIQGRHGGNSKTTCMAGELTASLPLCKCCHTGDVSLSVLAAVLTGYV